MDGETAALIKHSLSPLVAFRKAVPEHYQATPVGGLGERGSVGVELHTVSCQHVLGYESAPGPGVWRSVELEGVSGRVLVKDLAGWSGDARLFAVNSQASFGSGLLVPALQLGQLGQVQ